MKRKILVLGFILTVSFVKNIYSQIGSEVFKDLNFRFIGPEGNRTIAIAGVPGDPMINYIGAASGGLWKTTDGGLNWRPIFDDQDVSSIGSIAIAPSNPDILWVGTGETFVIRPAHAMGDGIYKSEDAGKTWKNMGLEKSGRIGRVIVHPTNPDIVYAAALGHTFGPQQDRGVFKTIDGGATWKQILFIDEGTGAADIAKTPYGITSDRERSNPNRQTRSTSSGEQPVSRQERFSAALTQGRKTAFSAMKTSLPCNPTASGTSTLARPATTPLGTTQ